MTLIEKIAKSEGKLRKRLLQLPPEAIVLLYSNSRKLFLSSLAADNSFPVKIVPPEMNVKAWGLKFRSPLFNAAGMFKTGIGYDLAFKQGAGAFLAGTTTNQVRKGNTKGLAVHPFMPYHSSGAASNWMGLPNAGHQEIAAKLAKIDKQAGCPLGASIAADSGLSENEILSGVVAGFEAYYSAGADFMELNESCPNVVGHSAKSNNFLDSALTARLVYVSEKFLKKRKRNMPVIVKFSNDTDPEMIPALVDLLADLGFDGVNFGNTSTKYEYYRNSIEPSDLKNYDYFTKMISGGLSGRLLSKSSLELSSKTARYIKKKNPSREFHVIRTGGVSSFKDIGESQKNDVMLNQWFTGYFDAFAKYGHDLYAKIYNQLLNQR